MIHHGISAVIVARNAERFLRAALQSVLEQTLPPAEVIVVDGNSEDATAEIARSFSGVKYELQKESGLANARNQGIQSSVGEFIAFLDADDLWLPNKLKTQLEHLHWKSEAMACLASVKLFLEPNVLLPSNYEPESFHKEQIGYTPGAMLARRTVFDRVGLFDPDLTIATDSDWFARFLDDKVPCAIIPDLVLFKRIHEGNISRNLPRYRAETYQVVRRSVKRKKNQDPA